MSADKKALEAILDKIAAEQEVRKSVEQNKLQDTEIANKIKDILKVK